MLKNTKTIVKFIKRLAMRTIVFILVMLVIAAIWQAVTPLINNNLALSQMENDDFAFAIMDTFNRIKPVASTIYTLVILWFVYTLGRDTYKFVKNNNTANKIISTNEKEN